MILDNYDDLDKACAGVPAEGASGEVDNGVLNWTRVCITPFQPRNSPQHRQSPLTHVVHGMPMRRAAMLRR